MRPKGLGRLFDKHAMVNHSIGEYVRGDVHTNTIEGYFSILKRGIHGVYHFRPVCTITVNACRPSIHLRMLRAGPRFGSWQARKARRHE
jgi:hypothetical protein